MHYKRTDRNYVMHRNKRARHERRIEEGSVLTTPAPSSQTQSLIGTPIPTQYQGRMMPSPQTNPMMPSPNQYQGQMMPPPNQGQIMPSPQTNTPQYTSRMEGQANQGHYLPHLLPQPELRPIPSTEPSFIHDTRPGRTSRYTSQTSFGSNWSHRY